MVFHQLDAGPLGIARRIVAERIVAKNSFFIRTSGWV
jgi:hypothetical protein